MSDPYFTIDPAYQQRVGEVLARALMVDMKDPETGVVLWRVGEMIRAMCEFQAVLLAGSQLSTPAKIREFAEDYAKRLRRLTAAAKEHNAEHGAPFPTYVMPADMN